MKKLQLTWSTWTTILYQWTGVSWLSDRNPFQLTIHSSSVTTSPWPEDTWRKAPLLPEREERFTFEMIKFIYVVSSYFIEFLVREAKADIRTFHLVAHSLGAHVAGEAGEQITIGRLSRISGKYRMRTPHLNC